MNLQYQVPIQWNQLDTTLYDQQQIAETINLCNLYNLYFQQKEHISLKIPELNEPTRPKQYKKVNPREYLDNKIKEILSKQDYNYLHE